MTRSAAVARRSRRTLSKQMAETLAEAAVAKGCTAAIVFPDGTRIELTPGADADKAEVSANPFANLQ